MSQKTETRIGPGCKIAYLYRVHRHKVAIDCSDMVNRGYTFEMCQNKTACILNPLRGNVLTSYTGRHILGDGEKNALHTMLFLLGSDGNLYNNVLFSTLVSVMLHAGLCAVLWEAVSQYAFVVLCYVC